MLEYKYSNGLKRRATVKGLKGAKPLKRPTIDTASVLRPVYDAYKALVKAVAKSKPTPILKALDSLQAATMDAHADILILNGEEDLTGAREVEG